MNERVLIAEDDADMRELLEEILSDAGYETVSAANGRLALANPYDPMAPWGELPLFLPWEPLQLGGG